MTRIGASMRRSIVRMLVVWFFLLVAALALHVLADLLTAIDATITTIRGFSAP